MRFPANQHRFQPEAQVAPAPPCAQSVERAALRGFDHALAGRCAH